MRDLSQLFDKLVLLAVDLTLSQRVNDESLSTIS